MSKRNRKDTRIQTIVKKLPLTGYLKCIVCFNRKSFQRPETSEDCTVIRSADVHQLQCAVVRMSRPRQGEISLQRVTDSNPAFTI